MHKHFGVLAEKLAKLTVAEEGAGEGSNKKRQREEVEKAEANPQKKLKGIG